MDKKILRDKTKRYLEDLQEEERQNVEFVQLEKVLSSKEWAEAETIAITVSKFPEWSTKYYVEKAWKEGKKVAIPKVSPSLKDMDFYLVRSYDQLIPGYSGIMEPDTSTCSIIHKIDIDLLFVPGLLFNYQGYRIGFGGGFYDRYLAGFHGTTVSITSEAQLKRKLPLEEHDIPVQVIITENRIIRVHEEE
ncbi:5-formyltetrahydrofolate cyclo-ligase [Salimicrobium flavidum]|uniref:5-formyltetrahydrofolate cyclo-ligase n=1 Tax=Salimicrobium flavidum TaxID=570947 RepID=A0A1N7IIR3_9BACI|nr:5-formyltetrahydrofolate cyclo-ligase [Salimicrobium flavidum]SIS36886.1 5-formyltetrahydrofolate cyclo-ligase [Salimicrobium flavidum]